MQINGYRTMWILVMFDLPTETKKARHDYAQFRKGLMEDGFDMMQYSVYSRCCPSRENTEVHINRVEAMVPPDGEIRIIVFTDKQFEKMHVFYGKIRKKPESAPRQLTFF